MNFDGDGLLTMLKDARSDPTTKDLGEPCHPTELTDCEYADNEGCERRIRKRVWEAG